MRSLAFCCISKKTIRKTAQLPKNRSKSEAPEGASSAPRDSAPPYWFPLIFMASVSNQVHHIGYHQHALKHCGSPSIQNMGSKEQQSIVYSQIRKTTCICELSSNSAISQDVQCGMFEAMYSRHTMSYQYEANIIDDHINRFCLPLQLVHQGPQAFRSISAASTTTEVLGEESKTGPKAANSNRKLSAKS